MKAYLPVLLVGLAAATFSASAAQDSAAGASPAMSARAKPMDCAKAKDKARCEALNKDIEACRGKTDDDWRECMHRPAAKFTSPKPRDCAKAKNKARCEAHALALEACKEKTTRAAHRKCMAEQPSAQASSKN